MREMVLNHASLAADSRSAAVAALKGVISGMAALVNCGTAGLILRSAQHSTQTLCAPGFSLFDALQDLRRTGAREESAFFKKLETKFPLVSDLGTEHKFLGCQTRDIPPDDGAPLLLCALDDSVAVGFPTHTDWRRDRITVRFEELLCDGTFSDKCKDIDHLSKADHAESICCRHRAKLRAGLRSGEELWRRRRELFPNLTFGLDVRKHVTAVPYFRTLIKRLSELDAAAASWTDDPAQPWTYNVTDESDTVKQHPRLRAARRFRSSSGAYEYFFWHARCGDGRIHLRFDAATREVEIGYIGRHLPL